MTDDDKIDDFLSGERLKKIDLSNRVGNQKPKYLTYDKPEEKALYHLRYEEFQPYQQVAENLNKIFGNDRTEEGVRQFTEEKIRLGQWPNLAVTKDMRDKKKDFFKKLGEPEVFKFDENPDLEMIVFGTIAPGKKASGFGKTFITLALLVQGALQFGLSLITNNPLLASLTDEELREKHFTDAEIHGIRTGVASGLESIGYKKFLELAKILHLEDDDFEEQKRLYALLGDEFGKIIEGRSYGDSWNILVTKLITNIRRKGVKLMAFTAQDSRELEKRVRGLFNYLIIPNGADYNYTDKDGNEYPTFLVFSEGFEDWDKITQQKRALGRCIEEQLVAEGARYCRTSIPVSEIKKLYDKNYVVRMDLGLEYADEEKTRVLDLFWEYLEAHPSLKTKNDAMLRSRLKGWLEGEGTGFWTALVANTAPNWLVNQTIVRIVNEQEAGETGGFNEGSEPQAIYCPTCHFPAINETYVMKHLLEVYNALAGFRRSQRITNADIERFRKSHPSVFTENLETHAYDQLLTYDLWLDRVFGRAPRGESEGDAHE